MKRRIFRVDQSSGAPSGLGPLEARVMDILWARDAPSSVNDVAALMRYGRGEKPLAYTTIKTILTNLADKGHVSKKAAGRLNVFVAKKSREAFARALIDDVVRPLMKTQRIPLLAHIAGELAGDDGSYAEFEKLLAEKRQQRRGG
jgi:predicted transcriptional regulator